MKLFINTAIREKVVIKINEDRYETDALENKSQQLLPFIEEKLAIYGKSIQDISEIEVFTGPGSYTGLRVGVSVAQALAWGLQVPLNGKLSSEQEFVKIEY